ncbi:MAG: acetylxylan esterase [Thermoleophilia bacterium]|nr:acetylxylan esterase [Thermoleophilia bacterium]
MRKLAVLVVTLAALTFAQSAEAAITEVFDGNGDIACTTQGPGPNVGQRWCGTGQYDQNNNTRSTVQSFDGVPIDVNVAFPDESQFGAGPYPLMMMFHGYGGGKINFTGMQRWLDKGYAVFSQTNRGFHESCGTPTSKLADLDCTTKGFARLDDTRYEVRDSQIFSGTLVDEGLVSPTKIAASGGSYGGGMSMALAALKNRVMMPDDSLVPWKSPVTLTPMSLAVALPNIPWTDLAYSLVPNGSNLDYIEDSSYFGRFGVMKQSFVNGLYVSGLAAFGNYAPPGLEPDADLTGWKNYLDAGEPYDGSPEGQAILEEIQTHHSSYFIDHSQAPAPMLISSGFTDDLFPVNEATRYYNRTRVEHPDSSVGLFFGDFGHQRAQNKAVVTNARIALENTWVDHYLGGVGPVPVADVTAYTQTCPSGAADVGPYVSADWASSAPGEIRYLGGDGTETVQPIGGDRAVGSAFNPAPSGQACTSAAGAKEAGTGNYELDPAPAGGFTILGLPTVVAKIEQAGDNSQIAARLVDVSPDGTSKTLVSRAIWRPYNDGFQVFQLNGNGWKVDEGHVLRLELLPFDGGDANASTGVLSNYGRPSNGQQVATFSRMDLRIPVVEQPGDLGGLVKAPAPKVLPDRPGVELAKGYESIGSITLDDYANGVEPPCPEGTIGTTPPDCQPPECLGAQAGSQLDCGPDTTIRGTVKVTGKVTLKGKVLKAKVKCGTGNDSCSKIGLAFKGAPKKGKKGKDLVIAKGKGLTAKPGQTKTVTLKLTGKARKFFKDRRHRGKKVRGPNSLRAKVLVNGKSAGFKTVKRVAKVK